MKINGSVTESLSKKYNIEKDAKEITEEVLQKVKDDDNFKVESTKDGVKIKEKLTE